jgi:hypothetical protein
MPKRLWGVPAYDGPHSRRIRKCREENPMRGQAAIRFAQYRTGMTVAEYIEACDALPLPNYALFDITWDTDPRRQFIELYG